MKKATKITNTNSKKMPPHWYKIYWGFCPACGKSQKYRVHQYGPKTPRHVRLSTLETYCGCEDE